MSTEWYITPIWNNEGRVQLPVVRRQSPVIISNSLSKLITRDLFGAMRFMLRAVSSAKRWKWALLLAGLTVLAAAASAIIPEQRQHAVAAYDQAQQMREALEARSEGKRSKEAYKKTIAAYYDVYRLNPGSSKSPGALEPSPSSTGKWGTSFLRIPTFWIRSNPTAS